MLNVLKYWNYQYFYLILQPDLPKTGYSLLFLIQEELVMWSHFNQT